MHADSPFSTAVVGATGGAGATRLSLEAAASLAAAGHDVLVVDAAFATEGLSRHVEGRIDADLTTLLCNPERPLADACYDHPTVDAPGRVALCPTFAPFERLARAKAPEAAQTLADRLVEAAHDFDYALVDTPPVAANQAVAAVTAADSRLVVLPPGERGVDALQRLRGRFADVGVSADLVVANRVDPAAAPPDADYAVPEFRGPGLAAAEPDSPTAQTVAALAGDCFGEDLGTPEPTTAGATVRRFATRSRTRARSTVRRLRR
ncbi:AAA family ATPase [Halospeciosus flavus]|uniref:AAA family ATPase n=1 Tax=Halospeciosus flavus TaxID=3032283 RepID=A0ABD5Z7J4_9EURY|nr:AAA family ATPase [Halospeciosus flavus]